VFVPKEPAVVLGSGNNPETEVNVEACSLANIPVLRRYGGGGTVVLYSGCVVVSLGCWVKEPFHNSLYFELINKSVIEALSAHWPDLPELSQAGISDIISAGRKVAGTSLFRSRNYLLYQASILIDLDRELVSSVLRHPTKEPDYRKGRSHKDFLTSLNEIAQNTRPVEMVAKGLAEVFDSVARRILDEHLIAPIESQKTALKARLERSLAGV
jgi:lipoate-protein ligase A